MPRTVAENLARVRDQIAAAASEVGRTPEAVRLIAVTKYADDDQVAALLAAGQLDVGESRPQQLARRAMLFPTARWHLIGHLQTNKISLAAPHAALIHSLDRDSLRDELARWGKRKNRRIPVLVEINISGDPDKHGYHPAELTHVLTELLAVPTLELRGLMGMSGLKSDAAQSRREFELLRELLEQARKQGLVSNECRELSMGMSDDFCQAIAAGSTLVRIGSALFEGLE